MPRVKKGKEVDEVVDPDLDLDLSTDEEVEVEVKPKKDKEVWPKIDGNGKFQAVSFKDGFVVYNQFGVRVSGILNSSEANDLVLKNNIAASLK